MHISRPVADEMQMKIFKVIYD